MVTRPQPSRLDRLARRYTVDRTFDAFVAACLKSPGYVPTMSPAHRSDREALELAELADAFDAAMTAAGDSRRAWRGSR